MWQDTKTTHRYFSVISLALLVCVLPETGALALIPSSSHGSGHDAHESSHETHDTRHAPPDDHHAVTHHATSSVPPRKVKKQKHDSAFSIDPKHESHEHHHNDHVEPEELEMEERERKIIFGNHQSFVFHNDQEKIAGVVSTVKKPFATV